MKYFLHILIIATIVLTAGCSTETKEPPQSLSDLCGSAHISVKALTSVDAQTRTATFELPQECIPDGSDFTLRITGTYTDESGDTQSYDQSWDKVSMYDSPLMLRSTYTAHISHGDPEAEGPLAACFTDAHDFTVYARRTVSVDVSATLTNAACRLAFDEWFNRYYTDARIILRTESGNSFTFDKNTAGIVFVKAGTELFIKGTAVKAQTGTPVEFPETRIGTSAQRTLHTITVGAAEAGGGKLEIFLDDLFTEMEEVVVELNPEV